MKSIIILKSLHHKNTEKVARAIAKTIGAKITTPERIKNGDLKEYDLVGFGSGIYFSMHHEDLFKLTSKIRRVKGKKAFIFSTSGTWNIKFLNDFNTPLKKKLENRGFNVIGIFNCRGYDTYGYLKKVGGLNKNKPGNRELEKAKQFGESLKHTIKALS